MTESPQPHRFPPGDCILPFARSEYEERLGGLRVIMDALEVGAAVVTSAHGIAYYAGLPCRPSGGPCGLVVTASQAVTIGAGGDGGRPARCPHGDTIGLADRRPGTFWRAVLSVTGPGRAIGCEAGHLTLRQSETLGSSLAPSRVIDIAPATARQRMTKSPAEIALIRAGAGIADLGGHAARAAIAVGAREIDVAMAGHEAMEREIARRFPGADCRATRVRVRSGIGTGGAQDPVAARRLRAGDILGLDCVAAIVGYCTALGRTMFLREVDAASLGIWEASLAAHEYGINLLKPGVSCAEVTAGIDGFLGGRHLLPYRSGHPLGMAGLCRHDEAGPGLPGGIDTVLEPGMVVSMAPMLTIPEGRPGAGGYCERDILVITAEGAESLTRHPRGPRFNVVG